MFLYMYSYASHNFFNVTAAFASTHYFQSCFSLYILIIQFQCHRPSMTFYDIITCNSIKNWQLPPRLLGSVILWHAVQVGSRLQRIDPVVADAVRDGGQDVLALVQRGYYKAVITLNISFFNLKTSMLFIKQENYIYKDNSCM